jgi:hypothetical protein
MAKVAPQRTVVVGFESNLSRAAYSWLQPIL